MADGTELLMFQSSHFNEKVRWALDYKGIPHRRRSLLPGPHARTVMKLTGQTEVPVLITDGTALHGSARIIDDLERRHSEPALYPIDPDQRERALEIQRWFDDEVGPSIRLAMFSILIDQPAYIAEVFGRAHSASQRMLYRCVVPLVRSRMVRQMSIREPHVSEAMTVTRAGFDFVANFVANEVGESGYLAGDRFSVADLAAASLLALGVENSHPDMRQPEPKPATIVAWFDRWRDHPGAAWVREIYARHRPMRAPEC